MSTDDRRDRLIRALEAALAEDPTDATEFPDQVEQARVSWLDQFRAGSRPFQQTETEAPVIDDLDLELWLLLEKEKVFRSGGPATPTAYRARTPEGIVLTVRPGEDGTWQVRVRKALPGAYRVDLSWADGAKATAEVTVVDGSSDFVALVGPQQPPVRALVTRLDS